MNSSVFGHLEASLNDYLGELIHRGASADESTAIHIAKVELPRIISALRGALQYHQPDHNGRCSACRTERFGRRPAPCRAYLTAHLCLVVVDRDESVSRPAAGRHTASATAEPAENS